MTLKERMSMLLSISKLTSNFRIYEQTLWRLSLRKSSLSRRKIRMKYKDRILQYWPFHQPQFQAVPPPQLCCLRCYPLKCRLEEGEIDFTGPTGFTELLAVAHELAKLNGDGSRGNIPGQNAVAPVVTPSTASLS